MPTTYLIHKPSSYYFRISIPVDLRPLFGKWEIQRSLRTGILKLARERAKLIAGKAQRLFRQLREGSMTELSQEQLQNLMRKFAQEALQDREYAIASDTRRLDEVDLDNNLHTVGYFQSEYQEGLATKNYKWAIPAANDIIKKANLNIQPDTPEYHLLCREVLKVMIEVSKIEERWVFGDYTVELPEKYRMSPQQTALPVQVLQAPVKEEPPAPKLSEIIHKYMQENIKAENWAPRTIGEYETCQKVVLALMDDEPVNKITPVKTREFKETLANMPPSFTRLKGFKNMTPAQLRTLPPQEKTTGIDSLNKHMAFAANVFQYAMDHHYIDSNPMQGLKVKQRRKKMRDNEKTESFTPDDLKTIFGCPEYLTDTHNQPFKFWLSPLALYTGCRLEEMCQLYCDDIKQIDGVWVIDICEGEDKHVKNRTSVRMVPLHPALVDELRFPQFVAQQKANGHKRIFPELRKIRTRYGHYPSRWFGTFRDNLELSPQKDGSRKVFHSFRDTFATIAHHNGMDDHALKALLGHAEDEMTFQVYADRLPVQRLYDELVKCVNFDLGDIGHLKASRYVPQGL